MHTPEHSQGVLRLHEFLSTRSKFVISFWFFALVLAGISAPYFIANSEDRLEAPKGSRAAKDLASFQQVFPFRANEETLVLFARSNSKSIVCPNSKCSRACKGVDEVTARVFHNVASHLLAQEEGLGYLSYYNVSDTSLDALKCNFASGDGKSTFGIFKYDPVKKSKTEIHALIAKAERALKKELELVENGYFDIVGWTGVDAFAKAGADASEAQLFTVDLVTMPVAFAIFAFMVRSPRLLLLCVMNMMITTVCAFGTLAFIVKAFGTRPMTVEGTLCQAISVAMSIDYSLFMMRRFKDEIKNGRTVEDASKIMLKRAGHVVLMTCSTFALVFVGFLFLPSEDLASLGQVCITALVCAFLVNISNTVAMIALFPVFFSTFSFSAGATATAPSSTREMLLGSSTTLTTRTRRGPPYTGWYFSFLKHATTFPKNIIFILVVYSLFVPLMIHATTIKHNQNAMQIAPKSAPSAKVYFALEQSFNPGLLGPFSIVVVSENPKIMVKTNPDYFNFVHAIVKRLQDDAGIPAGSFASITDIMGRTVSYAEARALLDSKSAFCSRVSPVHDLCAQYQWVWNDAVSPSGLAAIITVNLPVNPYGREGGEFVVSALKIMDDMQASSDGKYRLLLAGTEFSFHSDMNVAFGTLPILLLTTVLTVFLLIGFGFKSAFVPIRLSLSVFIPLGTVFGFSVLVYQDGILDWMHISSLQKTSDGFFYFIPVCCLMQALGLMLDYDILLLSRILEHRSHGYDLQASIIKGVWEVISTIIAAGLIMSSVFGGLLLSDESAVDQFGLILCSAVLMAIFIEAFIAPSIFSLGDKFSWWPNRVPQENLITIEDDEFKN